MIIRKVKAAGDGVQHRNLNSRGLARGKVYGTAHQRVTLGGAWKAGEPRRKGHKRTGDMERSPRVLCRTVISKKQQKTL